MGTQAGEDTGISKQATNSNNNPRARKQNKPWFDHDCFLKRKQYIRVKNRLKKIKFSQNDEALKQENKSYKKFINKKGIYIIKNCTKH